MPTDLAVDLVFEGQQPAVRGSGKAFGWKERYYLTTGGVDTAILAAQSDVAGANTNLTLLRRAFLHPVWRISYIIATDLLNKRITKVHAPSNLIGNAFAGAEETIPPPAQVQCAVAATIYRLPIGEDNHVHRRNLAVRGLPTSLINGNVVEIGTPHFLAVKAFLDLVGNHEGPRAQVLNFGPTGVWKIAWQDETALPQVITALAPLAPAGAIPGNARLIVMTCAGLGNVAKGDQVTIHGVGNLRGVNKTWRVLQDALAGTDILLGTNKFPLDVGATANLQGATARRKRTVIGSPDQYVIRGLTTRKTGRPINPLRGRASARSV